MAKAMMRAKDSLAEGQEEMGLRDFLGREDLYLIGEENGQSEEFEIMNIILH